MPKCHIRGTKLFKNNKFYEDISISEGLSSKEMINCSGIDEHQDVTERIHKKIISNKTEYVSVEDPLSMHRTGLNETAFVSEIPYIINVKNVIIAPGQGNKPVSILSDEFCEELAFPYLLPKGKFKIKAMKLLEIFQRLLNFNQHFASDAAYIILTRFIYEQQHLPSSINFALHKNKPGMLTTGTVECNFKGSFESFVARDKAF